MRNRILVALFFVFSGAHSSTPFATLEVNSTSDNPARSGAPAVTDIHINVDTISATPPTDSHGHASEFSVNVSVVEQLIVTTATDETDGECIVDCSLRDAVALAGNDAQITFDAALAGQTISLTLGDILVDKVLTITGADLSSPVTVSGNQSSRVFSLNGADLTLRSMILADGAVMGENGGLINAPDAGSVLTIEDSVLRNSFAEFEGGAIRFSTATPSTLTINRSSIISAFAGTFGGAIAAFSAQISITNSTIASGLAKIGGGISAQGDSSLTVINSTIAHNGSGGGSALHITDTSNATLTNSILANSSATIVRLCMIGPDASVSLNGPSIVEDGSCTAQDTVVEADLRRLTTPTPLVRALVPHPDSAAIDIADNLLCPPQDQLSEMRPFDGDNDGSAGCDLGAIEFDRFFADGVETP